MWLWSAKPLAAAASASLTASQLPLGARQPLLPGPGGRRQAEAGAERAQELIAAQARLARQFGQRGRGLCPISELLARPHQRGARAVRAPKFRAQLRRDRCVVQQHGQVLLQRQRRIAPDGAGKQRIEQPRHAPVVKHGMCPLKR